MFSKTLSISIKNDFRILNNNTLKKTTTLPENESPRGCFIGINNAVAEKSSILIIARNENEFSKYLNEAKEELRKYYSSNQPDLTGDPEPSKPERRGDSGKPGRRGDSGKPERRGTQENLEEEEIQENLEEEVTQENLEEGHHLKQKLLKNNFISIKLHNNLRIIC